MTEILIKSLDELKAHARAVTVPGWDEPDPVWTCPGCGAVNTGAFFHSDTPCSECHKFFYPKRGCKISDTLLKEIKKLEEEIEDNLREMESLEDEVHDLERQNEEIERRLKKLRCIKG